jgi:hypothetical protein
MRRLLRVRAIGGSIAPAALAVNQFPSKYFILQCEMTVNE